MTVQKKNYPLCNLGTGKLLLSYHLKLSLRSYHAWFSEWAERAIVYNKRHILQDAAAVIRLQPLRFDRQIHKWNTNQLNSVKIARIWPNRSIALERAVLLILDVKTRVWYGIARKTIFPYSMLAIFFHSTSISYWKFSVPCLTPY